MNGFGKKIKKPKTPANRDVEASRKTERQACQYHAQGKVAEAERLYLELIKNGTSSKKVLISAAEISLVKGKVNRAISFYDEAIRLNGPCPVTFNNLGQAYALKENCHKA